jgi:succinyl-diaminopimelate desuccinylase
VPNEARATLDIRFLNQRAYTKVHDDLTALAAEHEIFLSTRTLIKSIELDVGLPVIQEWIRIVSEQRGSDASNGYALSFGASDARFFAAKGIPAIVTRPDGGGMHGEYEWIEETSLYQFYDCLRTYLTVMAGGLDGTAATGYTKPKLPETVAVERSA